MEKEVASLQLQKVFGRARLNDRQINELMGLSAGIIADGKVSQLEAEFLQKWLAAHRDITDNPIINNLFLRVNEMLSDNILDTEEAGELAETLVKFSGANFELGELAKSTSLPLDNPPPEIIFNRRNFCFTGTFAFGTRADCESKMKALSGSTNPLTKQTDYLVIGIYATETWKHASYGNKILRAVTMQENGSGIAIIGEEHWLNTIDNL